MKPDNYYLELEKKGYYETIDKRSKDYREYKEWNKTKVSKDYEALKDNVAKQSEGVGDTVAKITKATGVDKLVKFIAGEDCGCDDRKEKLNKLFTYKKVNCISEEDYVYLNDFINSNPRKVTHNQKVRLIKIHNNVFNTNQRETSCEPCMIGIVNKLKKYLEVYK